MYEIAGGVGWVLLVRIDLMFPCIPLHASASLPTCPQSTPGND
jgi:hypothetical protein